MTFLSNYYYHASRCMYVFMYVCLYVCLYVLTANRNAMI